MKIKPLFLKIPKYTFVYYIIAGIVVYHFVDHNLLYFRRLNPLQKYSQTPVIHSRTTDQSISDHSFRLAIRYYKTLLKVYPKQQRAFDLIAYSYVQLKDYPKAKRYYRKTLKLDPDYYWSYLNLGIIHYKTQEYAKAIDALKSGLQTNPDFHNQIQRLFPEMNSEQKTKIEDLLKADFNKTKSSMQRLLLICFHKSGESEEMDAYFKEAEIIRIVEQLKTQKISEEIIGKILPSMNTVINPLNYFAIVGLEEIKEKR